MTVFKYALLRNIRTPLLFMATSLGPITVIFLMVDAWTYAPAAGVGMLAMLMMYSLNTSAGIILEDRIDGSVIRVATSPVSTLSYITQNLFAVILPTFIQILLLGTMGYFRYNWSIEFTLGVTLSFLIFAVANTAFAFTWNMFFKSKEGSKWTFLVVVMLIAFFGGLIIPTEFLPNILQHIGAIVHPYWLMRGVTSLWEEGITLTFWLYQLVLTLFAIGYLVIGGTRKMN